MYCGIYSLDHKSIHDKQFCNNKQLRPQYTDYKFADSLTYPIPIIKPYHCINYQRPALCSSSLISLRALSVTSPAFRIALSSMAASSVSPTHSPSRTYIYKCRVTTLKFIAIKVMDVSYISSEPPTEFFACFFYRHVKKKFSYPTHVSGLKTVQGLQIW